MNSKNKKSMVAIFAHPDDEAFGPSGTIHKFTKTHDVYLLCVTRGEIGKDSSRSSKMLADVRSDELKKSAEILGVKKVYFLGFTDGTLSNHLYHQLAAKIKRHLKRLKPEIVMTDEWRGVSGHIDHITTSMVTTFVVQKLNFVRQIFYYCISKEERESFGDDYFIYFPPGYNKDEINKSIDIKDVWETKVAAMYAHISQAHDIKRILDKKKLFKKECFLVHNLT